MDRIRNADGPVEPDYPVDSEAELIVDGERLQGRLQNTSTGGVAFRADATKLPANPRTVRLHIPNTPVNADMRIVAADQSIINLAFVEVSAGESALRWFTTAQKRGRAA